ncbi:L-gulono-1,4-lactone dehydrogenase [Actinomycetospora sp. NBRC 106375]|uniref:D-arabinono-1,4-lactone oxidase n=1 Tax=Actinomycetospora sp. NBRC 106375 TaxID=3032207 RepID=UPI00249FD070|nr:D-arabinono-1,4-lactone oxidase [Actinomycetospora sp. NBRC 106375]GLZ45759.1 L-gulono-1,4-lactone dehydrogenase [Actinomycetospora sp. NBRC 106375]
MWTNWSGGQQCRLTATVRPLDDSGVSAVVRRAAERGQTVRPVGAGHSFSALTVTDGVHVDLSAFRGVTASGGDPARPTVRVRAGTTLGELHDELATRGLALDAPLELAAPTVGGALAVGMHGSGPSRGSLSAAVARLRLVDGRGRLRDVAAADLDAARTSLGALGVVLEAELAVVPAGRVRVTREPRPVEEVLRSDFWSAHPVVEAAVFPSASTALTRWADPLTDAADDEDDGEEEAGERSLGVTVAGATGRTALGGAVVVERALPRLVPRFNRAVSRLARTVSASGPMHRVLSSPPAVRYEQTEWALPRAGLAAAARELLAALADDHLEVGLPVRLRVGAPESGWLHPAHDRATAWVAVRVPRHTDHGPVLERAWRVLRAHGGRPHWASRSDWTVEDTVAAYPRYPDFCRVRDDYDPDRVFTTPPLAAVLGD